MSFGTRTGQTDWGRYKDTLLRNSDVRKFNDIYRQILSGKPAQRESLEDWLAARYAARELVPEMRRVAPESDITFEQVGDVPHFEIDPAARLVRHVARCAGANDPGCYVAFGSEAGLFQRAGIPAVLCGPGHIEQAHKPDEFVSLDQVARCEEFMRRLCEASPSDA